MNFVGLTFLFLFAMVSAQADDLKSFTQGLDKTLRHVNRPEYNKPCAADSLAPASATLGMYQGQKVTVISEADAQKIFADLKSHTEIP